MFQGIGILLVAMLVVSLVLELTVHKLPAMKKMMVKERLDSLSILSLTWIVFFATFGLTLMIRILGGL